MFETSAETAELDGAIARAQGKFTIAKKDKNNPYFQSKYADLSSVIDACRTALVSEEISVTQWLLDSQKPNEVRILTRLAHKGQWMRATFAVPVVGIGKKDGQDDGRPRQITAQAFGSAVAYAKRYALAACVVVSIDDDDDGNAASGQQDQQRQGDSSRGGNQRRNANQSDPKGASNKRNEVVTKDGSDLEAALRAMRACKTKDELDAERARLRGLKWSASEKQVMLGCYNEHVATLEPDPEGTDRVKRCEACGTADDTKHQVGCPNAPEPGAGG